MLTRLLQSLKNQWQDLSLRRRGGIALTIPLVCISVVVVTDRLYDESVGQAELRVEYSQKVLLESRNLLNTLINAETGIRGYYLSRKAEFLEPYNSALKNLDPSINRLTNLIKYNPTQLQRVSVLRQIIQVRLNQFQVALQLMEDPTFFYSPSELYTNMSNGRLDMERIRKEIDQFDAEEGKELAISKQALLQQQNFNTAINWCSVIFSAIGTVISMFLFNSLVLELRRRELYLRRSRSLTDAIVANVVDGVVILNLQNQIESFNNTAVQMFGYTAEEAIGQHWKILFGEMTDDGKESLALIQADPKQVEYPWQTMGQRKQGDHFPIEVSFSDISFDNRRIMIVRDVTERQQAAAKLEGRATELAQLNASLNITNQALEERNKDLDQFTYVVSHDLKAPLRAIANLSEWIEEDIAGQISSETQSQMQLLRGRVYRLEGLLNGLLQYSRVGRTTSQIESVDVGELLKDIIDTIDPPDTFKVIVSDGMPVMKTRTLLLKQVFTNLIDNAIKHHPNEFGVVKVSVSDRRDRYEFAVADDGNGIDPQFHTKIFDVFQTLESRDKKESTGIGLSIVKKIIETEGGEIHLESQVGSGAIFRFTWLKSSIG